MAQIASSIANIPHLQAFDAVIEGAFGGIDKTLPLIYIIEVVSPVALDALADQFNMLGWRGWILADTEDKKRSLLKKAITLQRKKGTPFAVREAIKLLDIQGIMGDTDSIQILEGVGLSYDGSFNYDGTQNYGGGFWANFSVRIQVDGTFDGSAGNITAIERIINEYKNERSNLVEVIIIVN